MLADAWGTELGLPEELLSTMALVELPSLLPPPLGYEEAERVQNALYLQGIEVPVKALNGRLYVRAWALEGPKLGAEVRHFGPHLQPHRGAWALEKVP